MAEVKGAWFVTARRVILDQHGVGGLARVRASLGEDHAGSLAAPVASAWYPEAALQRALEAVNVDLCGGDPERLSAFVEACTVVGINRFLRAVLSLSSPAYVLAKMPTFWSRHRRNNGKLVVDIAARTSRLSYTGFPFFDDPTYRIFIRAIIRRTMEITSGERPEVTVRDYARDRLTLDVFFKTLRLR